MTITGSYIPEELLSTLSGDPNGNWTLRVTDDAGQDMEHLPHGHWLLFILMVFLMHGHPTFRIYFFIGRSHRCFCKSEQPLTM
ncbi:MAG: hypothetical protein IPN36_08415 [Bacteroidetes bacterium]|nr:hypothetical protein [Bacteroidota bacterium]